LRIGYVSPDFQWHAVMRFFEPILAHHDQRRFEIVLYSEVPGGDEVTARLRKMAATTYRTVGRRAVEVAAQVREDEIDIRVDLAGHTGHNRLDLFALKPAPVQVSYLGYCHTTGLPTVDYRIVDDVLEPQAAATAGTEQLVRIPGGFSCFQPPAGAPEVAPSPLVKTGRVTFGSHYGMPKLSAPLLETWRRLLDALPESRLLLQRPCNAAGVRILRERLTHYGIPDGRFEIRSTSRDEKQYLGAYADVDIVLDSFPFSGHTTTCEALWMGVPVITLCGDRPSARLSSSVLTALGHPEWIASDPQQYIELCVGLARYPQRLAALRRERRRQMQQRLCDGAAFTARLEGAFRTLWEAWCLSQGARLPRVSSQCDLSSAKGYFDARRFHEAEVLLRRIVSDDPFYADAYCLLGMVALAAERHGDAAGLIRQAIALRPQRSDFHESHWNIVRELPDAGQKETALRQAVELASRCPEAYENLGMFFKEEGRDAESAAWFADAVAIRRGRGQ